jgi:hypothetical protein
MVAFRTAAYDATGRARREAPMTADGMREVASEAELQELLPSHARLVKSVQPAEETLAELEHHYGPEYAKGLYG